MASDDVLDREEFDEALSEVGMHLSGRYEQMLLAHDAALRERVAELEETLSGMMDGTDCRLDHHGLCQAHGWDDDGNCPERRARRALDEGEDDGE